MDATYDEISTRRHGVALSLSRDRICLLHPPLATVPPCRDRLSETAEFRAEAAGPRLTTVLSSEKGADPMTRTCLTVLSIALVLNLSSVFAQATKEPLRIIVFGAHPDDCELIAGGSAAKWAALGHKVKFVSVTNGDIGHHEMAGGILARRRAAEVQKCAEILGIESEVLDNHDGELLPTLENREELTRQIRRWKADVVIAHRPNDYHPDHRYTGQLVQDAAFMVIVPNFCPDVLSLRKNPVFLYSEDRFQKPNPFEPDVVVPIDDAIEKKAQCYRALESQFYEWNPWLDGTLDEVPSDEPGRMNYARRIMQARHGGTANRFRAKLIEQLGQEAGNAVKTAEAFEVCEYGSQPSPEELRRLFPFFAQR